MRKAVIVFLCPLTCAGVAFADLGSVVLSWPSPSLNTTGVAASDSEVFIGLGYPSQFVHVYNRTTGSHIRSFPAITYQYGRGLAYTSGNRLWQLYISSYSGRVYETDAGAGSLINSWDLRYRYFDGLAPLCTGDGGQNTTRIILTYRYYSSYRLVYFLPSNGSVTGSYSISQPLLDIAYDWRNRIVWGPGTNSSERTVYGFSTTGSLVATFVGPNSGLRGAAYCGEYLYLASATRIYVVHCPGNVGVTPTSLGKVKVLFN